MGLILNIDTATETASVCISLHGESVALLQNEQQREHAAFIHLAIGQILNESGYKLNDVDAFAVTSGPGSYTGLRVGMATAKGFCYALSKPMIAVNTLEVMTRAALDQVTGIPDDALFCPMIDARRMEVFAALYDKDLQIVLQPSPLILNDDFFIPYLQQNQIFFFGSGSKKSEHILIHYNACFKAIHHSAKDLGKLAEKAFQEKKFADVTYSEPTYFKDFQHT